MRYKQGLSPGYIWPKVSDVSEMLFVHKEFFQLGSMIKLSKYETKQKSLFKAMVWIFQGRELSFPDNIMQG